MRSINMLSRLVLLLWYMKTVNAFSDCTTFNTSTLYSKDDPRNVTVTFSIPHYCSGQLNLKFVTVKSRLGSSKPDSVCSLLLTHLNDSQPNGNSTACFFHSDSKEYYVKWRLRSNVTDQPETLIISGSDQTGPKIQATIGLILPAAEISTQRFTEAKLKFNSTVYYSDETTEQEHVFKTTSHVYKDINHMTDAPAKNNPTSGQESSGSNFTQSPAFGIIILIAVSGMVILMIIVLLKQRGTDVTGSIRRKLSRRRTNADSYDCAAGAVSNVYAHHYDQATTAKLWTTGDTNQVERDPQGSDEYLEIIDVDLEQPKPTTVCKDRTKTI